MTTIAIVGTGIAGLTAAWHFQRAGQKVLLFERHKSLGLDGQSLEITCASCAGLMVVVRADVPSRIFNNRQWPNLMRLYEEIGVEFEAVDGSHSFCDLDRRCFARLASANQSNWSLRHLINSRARRILSGIRRLKALGSADLAIGMSEAETWEDYLKRSALAPGFIVDYLYPVLSSTVCTCSYASLKQYPAQVILETLDKLVDPRKSRHGNAADSGESKLLRIKHGVEAVTAKLTQGVHQTICETVVLAVRRSDDRVIVETESQSGRHSHEVDHVILATEAVDTLAVLREPAEAERRALECFRYETIPVALHRDAGLMPRTKSKWATFNFVSKQPGLGDSNSSMCTIWMNRFHSSWPEIEPIFQTIQPIWQPATDRMIRATTLRRPVVDRNSFAGWRALDDLHRERGRRIWFTGSYASPGVPLLETGVTSSLKLVKILCGLL
jgi:predicted NAD/FAD-binding protein